MSEYLRELEELFPGWSIRGIYEYYRNVKDYPGEEDVVYSWCAAHYPATKSLFELRHKNVQ